MLIIQPQSRSQSNAIRRLHEQAFGGPGEARLVDLIRQSADYIPQLSLVALQDKELVGHLLLSPIVVEGAERSWPALALAPLAVLPDRQNMGIGSQLMRCALERCEALEHRLVIVLGHPRYYTRFGFEPALPYGILPPFPLEEEAAFMVWCSDRKLLESVKGTVRYPAVFDSVSPE